MKKAECREAEDKAGLHESRGEPYRLGSGTEAGAVESKGVPTAHIRIAKSGLLQVSGLLLCDWWE